MSSRTIHVPVSALTTSPYHWGPPSFPAGTLMPARAVTFAEDPPARPAAVPKRPENTARVAELEERTAYLELQASEKQRQLKQLNQQIHNHAKAKALFTRGLSTGLSRFAAGLRLPR